MPVIRSPPPLRYKSDAHLSPPYKPDAHLSFPRYKSDAPVIRAARERGIDVAISVDTFRASVARDAVAAGANFINDVCPRPKQTHFY